MASTDNELQTQHPRTQFQFKAPNYTLGYLIIVVTIAIGTSIVILSSTYSKCQADGQKIMDENQWFRVILSPFAVASFQDLFFMFIAFLWLLFTLTDYERKYSTAYTLFHFWKVNINIDMGVAWMYWILFKLTGMKNFIMNVGGIFPYALHIYLKGCLEKPSDPINHWFLPFPVNRWVMGFLVSITLILTTPQSQGCLVVFFYYLLCSFLVFLRHVTKISCIYFEGPACYWPVRIVQKLIPNCIKSHPGFCSVDACAQKQEEGQRQEQRREELEEEISEQN